MTEREDLLDEIAAKTQLMRQAQKEYFKSHTNARLAKAKQRERQVDELLARFRSGQKELFTSSP